MIIERDKQDIIIRIKSSLIDMEEAQKFADYFRLIESNAQNLGTQEDADSLARISQQDWAKENRKRFIK
jgi:hypothetical protein